MHSVTREITIIHPQLRNILPAKYFSLPRDGPVNRWFSK
jgi:hypothetical protein